MCANLTTIPGYGDEYEISKAQRDDQTTFSKKAILQLYFPITDFNQVKNLKPWYLARKRLLKDQNRRFGLG